MINRAGLSYHTGYCYRGQWNSHTGLACVAVILWKHMVG